jgi:hypothetical protein
MKAISLWQPWASAMAIGAKKIETRCWSTKYRGPLAIHAAKRYNKSEMKRLLTSHWIWKNIFHVKGEDVPTADEIMCALPFGKIIAIVDLDYCLATDSIWDAPALNAYDGRERGLGDYSFGRFAWITSNLRQFHKPIAWKGSQGFFNVPDDIIKQTSFIEKGKERL